MVTDQNEKRVVQSISDAFSGTYIRYGNLQLAPMLLEDLDDMADWPRFEDRKLAWANFPAQTAELKKRWYIQQQKPHLQWIIIRDMETEELLGRCSLSEPLSGNSIMYGIVIHPHKLGQGLGTQITKLMLSYIFKVSAINAVWLESRYDNERAQRTWEKIGFIHHGMHFRREVFGRYDRYIGYEFSRDQLELMDLPEIEIQYLD